MFTIYRLYCVIAKLALRRWLTKNLKLSASVRIMVSAGLVGGGPTFVGTLLGSLWTSTALNIFFLSVAGGALIYVSMLMYSSGRRQTTNSILMVGFFVGLLAGFVTDLIVTLGGA